MCAEEHALLHAPCIYGAGSPCILPLLLSLHSDEVQGRVLTVQHCGLNYDEASRIQRDHANHARWVDAVWVDAVHSNLLYRSQSQQQGMWGDGGQNATAVETI